MRPMHLLLCLPLVACGGPQAQPAASPAPLPATPAAPPTTPATQQASNAGTCPLLCWLEAGTCQRPDLTKAQLDNATCGLRQQLTRSPRRPPMVPCPAHCCQAKGAGNVGDKDADGIPDDVDKCPDDPEDYDGYDDWDGCPDPDNDHDGIADVNDMCCFAPEDKDGDRDLDGCPE